MQPRLRSAGPEVGPAAGAGWTRPANPGVRCLPCIRRPPLAAPRSWHLPVPACAWPVKRAPARRGRYTGRRL